MRETNASEPLMKHRETFNDIKTGVLKLLRDQHGRRLLRPCGVRCIGGVTLIGFRTELETLAGDAKGKAQAVTPRGRKDRCAGEGRTAWWYAESGVMPVEQRQRHRTLGVSDWSTGGAPILDGRRQTFAWWQRADDASVASGGSLRSGWGANSRADSAPTSLSTTTASPAVRSGRRRCAHRPALAASSSASFPRTG